MVIVWGLGRREGRGRVWWVFSLVTKILSFKNNVLNLLSGSILSLRTLQPISLACCSHVISMHLWSKEGISPVIRCPSIPVPYCIMNQQGHFRALDLVCLFMVWSVKVRDKNILLLWKQKIEKLFLKCFPKGSGCPAIVKRNEGIVSSLRIEKTALVLSCFRGSFLSSNQC